MFLPILASELISTNLEENRPLHQFYWDLSHFLAGNMTKDLSRNKICQRLCLLMSRFDNFPAFLEMTKYTIWNVIGHIHETH